MKNRTINFLNKNVNVIITLITIFIAFGLNLYFIQEGNYLKLSSESYNILFLIFIIGIFILLRKAYNIKEKRLWICTSILSIIFAIAYFCGDIGNMYCNGTIPNSKKFILYVIIKIATYFIVFDNILALIFLNHLKIKE